MSTPGSLFRNPRRFACDHCRMAKLRCRRDEQQPSCERCVQARLACTTTLAEATTATHTAARRGGSTRTSSRPRVPAPCRGSWVPSPPRYAALQPRSPASLDCQAAAAASLPQPALVDLSPHPPTNVQALDSLDFAMPDMAFDAASLAMLMAANPPLAGHEQAGRQASSGASSGSAGFLWPDAGLASHDSGFVSGTPVLGADETDSSPRAPSSSSSSSLPAASPPPPSSYGDLLALSAELHEDRARMDAAAPLRNQEHLHRMCSAPQQALYINRVLDQAGRLWAIVERLHGRADTNTTGADHLLVVNLVMAYVYLVRGCRALLARLLDALRAAGGGGGGGGGGGPVLHLPRLQFGTFRVDDGNVALQAKLLVDLCTSQLLRIGRALGIRDETSRPGSPADPADPADPPDHGRLRLAFMGDPAAAAARESILAKERAQAKTAAASGRRDDEPPSLPSIVHDLRQLLSQRYGVVEM